MNDRSATTSGRGLSPALGLGLLIVVTLLVATTVGAMVLGLAGGLSDEPPDATFDVATDGVGDELGAEDEVTLRHAGGERISTNRLSVVVGDAAVYVNGTVVADPDADATDELTQVRSWGASVAEGSELTIRETGEESVFGAGDRVELRWHGPDGTVVLAAGTL